MVLFILHDPDALAVNFKPFIISITLSTVLFANQKMICYTSVEHARLVLSWLLNTTALAADFEQVIVPVIFSGYLFPAFFANQLLICFMSAAHGSPISSPLYLRWDGWLWTGHDMVLLYLALVVNYTLFY